MIQTFSDFLFKIWFSGVQNIIIFIDHFETQKLVQAPL